MLWIKSWWLAVPVPLSFLAVLIAIDEQYHILFFFSYLFAQGVLTLFLHFKN